MSDDSEKSGLNKLSRYSGEGRDKTSSGLRQFKVNLKDYLTVKNIELTQFTSETRAAKLHAYVNSFLSGKAATYFSAIRDTQPPLDFNAIFDRLEKRFIPSTSQSELIQKWNRIGQYSNRSIRPITDVITELQDIEAQLPGDFYNS